MITDCRCGMGDEDWWACVNGAVYGPCEYESCAATPVMA